MLFTAVAAVLFAQAFLLPSLPVWITDNGNRIMTVRTIAETGSSAFEPPFGEAELFPGIFHFQRAPDGTIRSVLPDIFPYLEAVPYKIFGPRGLMLLPILGILMTAWFFMAALRTLHFSRRQQLIYPVLLLISAPFLFYGGTVWEMTLGTAFAAAGLYYAVRRNYLAAGLTLGLGVWLREECGFILVLAFLSALVFYWRSLKTWAPRLILGAAAAILPLLWMNWARFGHILGLHGALYYTHNAGGENVWSPGSLLRGIPFGYALYWFRFDEWGPGGWLRYLPAAPIAVLTAAGAFRGYERTKRAILWAALAGWLVMFTGLLFHNGLIRGAGLNVGLVSASPMFAGFFLMWRELLTSGQRTVRAAALFTILYCVILPVLLTRTDIGVIWGPRHFMPIAILLFLLGSFGFERLGVFHRRPRIQPVLAITAAVLFTIAGEIALFTQSYAAADAADALDAASEQVIVTDVFFLPEMTPELTKNHVFAAVRDDKDIPKVLAAMRKHGVRKFSLVLSASDPYFGSITNDGLELLNNEPGLTAAEQIRRIRNSPRTFLDFDVISAELK